MSSAPRKQSTPRSVSPQQPRHASHAPSSSSRPPPTGPRAYKKPRLAEPYAQHQHYQPQQSPPHHSVRHARTSSSSRSHGGGGGRERDRERGRRPVSPVRPMDVDDDLRSDRRDKEHDRDARSERSRKETYRERDREDGLSRKQGRHGARNSGSNGRGARRTGASEASSLAERMGL